MPTSNWLFAVLGQTPSVLTEIAWWLVRNERLRFDQVEVWTTVVNPLVPTPEPRGRNMLIDRTGWEQLRRELERQGFADHLPPADRIDFQLFEGTSGGYLDDIRSSADAESAHQQLGSRIWQLHQEHPDVVLHACLSGGRKTMSASLQSAIELFGAREDRLYHVLVHGDIEAPPQNSLLSSFLYPRDDIARGAQKTFTPDRSRPDVTTSVRVQIPLDEQITVFHIPTPRLRDLLPPESHRLIVENVVGAVEMVNQRIAEVAEECRLVNDGLTSTSPEINNVRRLIKLYSPTDLTVIITGESGTGKEVVARMIHDNSNRHDKPFIAVNCAALAPTLIESELFGHERGAFTSAGKQRIGYFEKAKGGTLFLDEIAELSTDLQAKLLRVIQERVIRRVGGNEEIPVDVRVITATHHNLENDVTQGSFRGDLFYRIGVLPIKMPPLRRRTEDIPGLATHILTHYLEWKLFSPEALELLTAHHWSGNVRELQNIVWRAAVLSGTETMIRPEHIVLPSHIPTPGGQSSDFIENADPHSLSPEQLVAHVQAAAVRCLNAHGEINKTAFARALFHRDNLPTETAKRELKKLLYPSDARRRDALERLFNTLPETAPLRVLCRELHP